VRTFAFLFAGLDGSESNDDDEDERQHENALAATGWVDAHKIRPSSPPLLRSRQSSKWPTTHHKRRHQQLCFWSIDRTDADICFISTNTRR